MAKAAKEALAPASGVDALIAKLRDEGVSAGRGQADKIIADARAQAAEIVEKAKAEAKEHLVAARKEGDAYKSAGEEAVKTALRDTVLDMKSRLMQRFSADVKRLAAEELGKDDTLKQMILELVGRAGADTGLAKAGEVEVVAVVVLHPVAAAQAHEPAVGKQVDVVVLGRGCGRGEQQGCESQAQNVACGHVLPPSRCRPARFAAQP